MKNYRKAKPGDVPCRECMYSREPCVVGERWRCHWGSDHDFLYTPEVVSQYKTCNYVTPEGDK